MAKNEFKDLKLYYSNSMISLKDGDYDEAIKGFKYLIKHGIEIQKSVLGLITAYSCITRYNNALKIYEEHKEFFTGKTPYKGMFVEIMTALLIKESTLLKKNTRGYLTGIITARRMKEVYEAYLVNPENLLCIVLICYWYAVLAKRPKDTEQMMVRFVNDEHIEDEFRWKLLEKLAITDKQIMEDITIAGKFKRIPRYLDHSYVNLLLFSSLSSNNLIIARENIEVQRMNGVQLSDDVMWNYLDLCVENDDIDDLAVNFAKRLFSKGWMDPVIAKVLRYAKDNLNIYNVKNEMKSLELFGI
ncbi:MAG: hypothetical protein PHY13_04775 [Clostridia bacterium]|nr:hypothetical protein [Clostridia bacterium]